MDFRNYLFQAAAGEKIRPLHSNAPIRIGLPKRASGLINAHPIACPCTPLFKFACARMQMHEPAEQALQRFFIEGNKGVRGVWRDKAICDAK